MNRRLMFMFIVLPVLRIGKVEKYEDKKLTRFYEWLRFQYVHDQSFAAFHCISNANVASRVVGKS